MAGTVISAEVSEELSDRIQDFQQEGESRSEAIRRLCRRGLDEGPGDGMYAVIVTFALAWAIVVYFVDSPVALRIESGIFHLLTIWWVTFPKVRERVDNLRE